MAQILWLVFSLVLLVLTAGLMWMARPIFFPTGERIFFAGFSLSLGLGTFFLMTELAELSTIVAGIIAISALLIGWFEPEIEREILIFKDPGLTPKAPDK